MKNTKKILAWVLAWAFILTGSSIYAAWNGQEQWGGQWFWKSLTTLEKEYIHSLDETERKQYVEQLKVKKWFSWKSKQNKMKGEG